MERKISFYSKEFRETLRSLSERFGNGSPPKNIFIFYADKLKKVNNVLKNCSKNNIRINAYYALIKNRLGGLDASLEILPIVEEAFRIIGTYLEQNDYLNDVDYRYLLDKFIFGKIDDDPFFADIENTDFNYLFRFTTEEEQKEFTKKGIGGKYSESTQEIVIDNNYKKNSYGVTILCHEIIHFLTLTYQRYYQRKIERKLNLGIHGYDFGNNSENPVFIIEGLTEALTHDMCHSNIRNGYRYNVIFINLAMELFKEDSYLSFIKGNNFLYRVNPLDYYELNIACNIFHEKNRDNKATEADFNHLLFKLIDFKLKTVLRFNKWDIVKEYLDIVKFLRKYMIMTNDLDVMLGSFENNLPRDIRENIRLYRQIAFNMNSYNQEYLNMLDKGCTYEEIHSVIDKKTEKETAKKVFRINDKGQLNFLKGGRIVKENNDMNCYLVTPFKKIPIKYDLMTSTYYDDKGNRYINPAELERNIFKRRFDYESVPLSSIDRMDRDAVRLSSTRMNFGFIRMPLADKYYDGDWHLILSDEDDKLYLSYLSIHEIDQMYIYEKARELFFDNKYGVQYQIKGPINLQKGEACYNVLMQHNMRLPYNFYRSVSVNYYTMLCMNVINEFRRMSANDKFQIRSKIASEYPCLTIEKRLYRNIM